MATRIRLQRHGKKGKPFFHLVAADSRAKRDGKFIEKLGTYNPTANPAVIDINFERTLSWVQTGAEMSDTAKAILSYKGVLFKNHLIKGVAKGALTMEQVEEKFTAWLFAKDSKIEGKKDGLVKNAEQERASRLKAEEAVNSAKAAELAIKNAPVVEEVVAEEAPAEEVAADETVAAEAIAEQVVTEIAEEKVVEEVVAEVIPEEVVAEAEATIVEEVVAEAAPTEAAATEETTNNEAQEESAAE